MPTTFETPPIPGSGFVKVNQTVTGSAASDTFTSGAGDDAFDGGSGVDAVVYSIARSNATLKVVTGGFSLTDKSGALGTDTLTSIERLKFTDGSIALDVGATQAAGQTALLMGAVLPGKLYLDASKQALLGSVISLFDQTYTMQQLSGALMRLPIWNVLTGNANPKSADIAKYLLTNVNGAAPDSATLATATAALDAQPDINHNQGDFLWHLAESAANQTHVGLVGLAATGLAYG